MAVDYCWYNKKVGENNIRIRRGQEEISQTQNFSKSVGSSVISPSKKDKRKKLIDISYGVSRGEVWCSCAIRDTQNISQVPNWYRGMELWNSASNSSTKIQRSIGRDGWGDLGWQETLQQMGRGQLCRQCENGVRVGWLVIALSWGNWSWHYQKVISYSCLYLALLKMNCEKQILLKVGAFVLFEARNWLIGRNNFTVLIYSASC